MIGEIALAHLVGDYILQSHWEAQEKTNRWWPAVLHAVTYGLPFLFVTQSPWALLVIVGTHAVLDRYRLARHVIWLKNHLAPRHTWRPWSECSATGFPPETPPWLAVWLLIIVDNAIHLLINFAAVYWL